jgi:hypothetical protein
MSFENDLMYAANGVKSKAILRAFQQERAHLTGYYGTDIEKYFEPVPRMFEPFAKMPVPESYDGIKTQVYRSLHMLSWGEAPSEVALPLVPANPNLELIRGSGTAMATWHGPAADEFRANFITPFSPVAKNQFIAVAALKGALEAHQLMWAKAQHDIMDIANKTDKALDAVVGESDEKDHNPGGTMCFDHGPEAFQVLFTVVEAVATLGALIVAPEVTGAEIAITAVAAAAGVGANWPHESAPSGSVGGNMVYEVMASMAARINDLHRYIYHTEQKIAEAMQDAHKAVEGTKRYFVTNRPQLANANAGNVRSQLGEAW